MSDLEVLAVVGPTATGKTALGIEIALRLGGEVVSADSRQVYKGLDIGTGKATAEEMRGVPHHLIDVADPKERFSAADFTRLGRTTLDEIRARGKVPIIVGGTGMYIDALLGRLQLNSALPNPALRTRLERLETTELITELASRDPERIKTIDTHNRRRLIRAIEIASSPAATLDSEHPTPNYSVLWIGLTLPSPQLKEHISDRLRARLEAGMLDEAKHLHTAGLSYERMDELGLEYRYMARHLQGFLTYEEMVSVLESEIYKYAKRQMTWFKRNADIKWFDANNPETTLASLAILAPNLGWWR